MSMGLINDIYGLSHRKKLKLAVDILIFLFMISGVILYSWSFRQGFDYASSWYLQNCFCSKEIPTGSMSDITIPQSDYFP